MKTLKISLILTTLAASLVLVVVAQPPPRTHDITTKGELIKRPAVSSPEIKNEVKIEIVGDERVITSNGVPNHKTGQFPNRGNPNRITAQSHEYRVPAKPKVAANTTPMRGEFGVAINGVPFDPGAGEFYAGEPGWQYEPLSGAIDLGIDVSHAHVQPTGKYHYHGLPTGLIDSVKVEDGAHSPLVGWAADGFPIYAVYGYSDPQDSQSSIQKLSSSYQLKEGDRPGGNAPDGKYDGTFVRDYEYVEGTGDLDECNGRFAVTPEYPEGTYAYFMTENWPVVPRLYRGTPSADFRHGPGGGGPGGAGPPGRGGERMLSGRGERGGERGGRREFGGGGMRPGGGGFERGGRGPQGGPPRPGQILPDFIQQSLSLSDAQRQKIAALQQKVDQELENILTPAQQEQLQNPHGFGPPGSRPGPMPGAGQGGPDRGGPGQSRPRRPQ